MVLAYPLMRTIIRGSLITEDLLRLAYCQFCSPSGVHSLPVSLPPSHRRRLSQNEVVGSYSLSFNGLTDYYIDPLKLSTVFFIRSHTAMIHQSMDSKTNIYPLQFISASSSHISLLIPSDDLRSRVILSPLYLNPLRDTFTIMSPYGISET